MAAPCVIHQQRRAPILWPPHPRPRPADVTAVEKLLAVHCKAPLSAAELANMTREQVEREE